MHPKEPPEEIFWDPFGTLFGIIISLLFILLMNIFQIIPEEEALLQIFGEEYLEYKKKVLEEILKLMKKLLLKLKKLFIGKCQKKYLKK